MLIKILLVVIFFGVMLGIGLYCRKHSTDVSGFVLAGRSVGPWLTAFAYGTSYFSAVVFVGYAGQFGWRYGLASTWVGLGNAFIGSLMAWAVLGQRDNAGLFRKTFHQSCTEDCRVSDMFRVPDTLHRITV